MSSWLGENKGEDFRPLYVFTTMTVWTPQKHRVGENWALTMTQNVACPTLQHNATQCLLIVDPKSRRHHADLYTVPLGMGNWWLDRAKYWAKLFRETGLNLYGMQNNCIFICKMKRISFYSIFIRRSVWGIQIPVFKKKLCLFNLPSTQAVWGVLQHKVLL